MRVRCLTTGAVRAKRGERGVRRYLADDWRDEALPVHAFLVEHPAGLCLFDTGQTAAAREPGYFARWQPFFRLSRFELTEADEVGAQLRRNGVDPADLRWIVLSHLHTDHVGGLRSLPAHEVVVSRVEWERATGWRGAVRGYQPHTWPERHVPRLVDFAGTPAAPPFTGSYDLAGDGRLLFLPTPGHTRGHAALLVDRRWLLGGDLAHSAAELDQRAPDVAAFCTREGVRFLAAHDPRAPDLLDD